MSSRKSKYIPRNSSNRRPKGKNNISGRQRNTGHKRGEEHSRTAKGNRGGSGKGKLFGIF